MVMQQQKQIYALNLVSMLPPLSIECWIHNILTAYGFVVTASMIYCIFLVMDISLSCYTTL